MDNPQTSALPQHWEYNTQDEEKQNKRYSTVQMVNPVTHEGETVH